MTLEAPDDLGAMTPPIERPTLRWLLWYSLGGSVPRRYRGWVLHDTTCRTWMLRHFARTLLLIVPLFVLYMIFMPASPGVRLYTGITFSGALLVLSVVFILIDNDRRAVRAGFRSGLVSEIRTARAVEGQRLASHQRRERIAARQRRR